MLKVFFLFWYINHFYFFIKTQNVNNKYLITKLENQVGKTKLENQVGTPDVNKNAGCHFFKNSLEELSRPHISYSGFQSHHK